MRSRIAIYSEAHRARPAATTAMPAATMFIMATRRASRIGATSCAVTASTSRRTASAAAFAPSCIPRVMASLLAANAALSVLSAFPLASSPHRWAMDSSSDLKASKISCWAECLFVVWLNPYWGPIEHEGKGFEQLKAYTTNKGRVSAIIQIPALKEETYGRDFAEMLQDRRTFDEALADSALTIMTRQRLKIVKTQLFAQLENAAVL